MNQPSALIALLDDWGSARGLATGFALRLLNTCPWLDGQETISVELAPQLLEEVLVQHGLPRSAAESLSIAYNAYVERDFLATAPGRNSAYTAMAEILAQHGSLGVGETFWLVEDSFSYSKPCVVVKDPSSLNEELMKAVAEAAARCPDFTAVIFSDEDGHNTLELSAR